MINSLSPLKSSLTRRKPSYSLLLNLSVSRPISSNTNFHPNEDRTHNFYHFSNQLIKCNKPSFLFTTKSIHSKLIKLAHVPFTLFLQNHLINSYFKCGDQLNAVKVFDEMLERNIATWTLLVAGFAKLGLAKNAIFVFCSMNRQGFKPNEFTFMGVLQACSCIEYIHNFVHQIYGLVIRSGFESNVFLCNAYLTALIHHNQFSEALEAFEKCLVKDIVSWNAMLAGYLQFSKSGIPKFWDRMIRAGLVPDNYTYASVLTGLADILDVRFGAQVHCQLVKSGHGIEMCVGNALVDMYLNNQDFNNGVRAFNEIPTRDVWSWTQMANGCLNCGEPKASLGFISEMRKTGTNPNKFTLATMLSACAKLVSLEDGKRVHGLRIKLGYDTDVCVENALIDMYAKFGSMDCALRVFQSMSDRSIVSWTSMISGYAQNGHANLAIELFDELTKHGINPNYITFISLLFACSQRGLVDKGWEYFCSMERDYGISPGEDHYVCMVDLFGRVGHTREAEELILSMPFEASGLVWKTLLGACQVHGDVATAKRVASRVLDLEREDPSTYVLVANVLAGLNNWDGVGLMRELMESRKVNKMPASSWLQI